MIIQKVLNEFPIIAALKDMAGVEYVCRAKPKICFVLGGDIMSVPKMISKLKESDKYVFVHLDMINGLGADKSAVKYIATNWRPSGIITTRKNLIKCAKDEGLSTVQRIFLLDSTSIKSGIKMAESANPDIVEVVPGVIYKAIKEIRQNLGPKVIAGGMITSADEIKSAFDAGAKGVSTSLKQLWDI